MSSSANAQSVGPVEKLRSEYAPLPFDVHHVDLCIKLSDGESPTDKQTVVESTIQLKPQPSAPSLTELSLDCEDVEVRSVKVNGVAVAFTLAEDVLTIPLTSVPKSQEYTLELVCRMH